MAFFGKACLIGLIRPKDGFRIASPGIGIFDDEEKSVIDRNLLSSGEAAEVGVL